MRIEGTFLRSSIARRILALFVLCASIPALALAVLSLGQVRAVLTEQSQAQLRAASKVYALNVYERLLLAHQSLHQIALGLHEGRPPGSDVLQTLAHTYSSLSVVGPGIEPIPILGKAISWPQLSDSARAHLISGESVLVVERVIGAPPRVLLVHAVDANRPARFALAAELNPVGLWGDSDGFSEAIGLCVLADTGASLFCSKSESASDPADPTRTISDSARDSRADTGKEAMIVGQWQLFLKPKFFTPYWIVIATEPASAVMAPIDKFSRIFLQVTVLSLLMVALFSLSQIRRTMGPLEKLIDGIRRLAGADFSHRVAVTGNDEFGELAGAFNDMAARLGRQLDTLKVLSAIDQVILSRLDIEPVFGLVLTRVCELTPAGFVAIAALEASGTGQARMYTLAAGRGGSCQMRRTCVAVPLLERIARQPGGFWLEQLDGLPLDPPELAAAGDGAQVFVLPIRDRGSLCAFACLGLPRGARLADSVQPDLRDLCDRIGVALSAAARDEQLVYQVRHDDLTGLPNRLLFKERLLQEIASARRERRSLALLYIDLDRFKGINDSLGHTVGDELLEQTARRMRNCIRETDSLARLGGDEFAIILPNISGVRDVTTVAEHIVQALSDPFVVGQQESFISASVGIAICPTDASDGEDLLKQADTAMYRAKDGGRGQFVYFEERMNAEAVERLALERELRQALLRNEFVLQYQPQLDLRTGRICGAEALLRWNHPIRGLIAPGVFIGVAEDTGLIEEIGRRVMLEACAQHAAWRSAGAQPPRIAVNVSGRQFRRGDLVRMVEDALRQSGTSASALEIEVTESLFMDESANAVAVLSQLRQMGAQVAIDDFGTGYSSMSYLKRLPVDVLKIDQSFIADMADNYDARAIAKAIINLAHTLNKSVVAEGVETAEQLVLLKRWRCNRIQGYYLSRPLTSDQFLELLHQRQQEAEQSGAATVQFEPQVP
ncbi:MAG TPA: EAL domain-containing protein [Burkholderiaceae bacterium]|nr:EAL domain-containing protein [Burkholderiaceae bacterium]